MSRSSLRSVPPAKEESGRAFPDCSRCTTSSRKADSLIGEKPVYVVHGLLRLFWPRRGRRRGWRIGNRITHAGCAVSPVCIFLGHKAPGWIAVRGLLNFFLTFQGCQRLCLIVSGAVREGCPMALTSASFVKLPIPWERLIQYEDTCRLS